MLSVILSATLWPTGEVPSGCYLSGNPTQVGGGMSCLKGAGNHRGTGFQSKAQANQWFGGWNVKLKTRSVQKAVGGNGAPDPQSPRKVEKLRSAYNELIHEMNKVLNVSQMLNRQ
ncbi:MAG: hypothetical protein ACR2PX_25970 [Endozoicomonas sp.]